MSPPSLVFWMRLFGGAGFVLGVVGGAIAGFWPEASDTSTWEWGVTTSLAAVVYLLTVLVEGIRVKEEGD